MLGEDAVSWGLKNLPEVVGWLVPFLLYIISLCHFCSGWHCIIILYSTDGREFPTTSERERERIRHSTDRGSPKVFLNQNLPRKPVTKAEKSELKPLWDCLRLFNFFHSTPWFHVLSSFLVCFMVCCPFVSMSDGGIISACF